MSNTYLYLRDDTVDLDKLYRLCLLCDEFETSLKHPVYKQMLSCGHLGSNIRKSNVSTCCLLNLDFIFKVSSNPSVDFKVANDCCRGVVLLS